MFDNLKTSDLPKYYFKKLFKNSFKELEDLSQDSNAMKGWFLRLQLKTILINLLTIIILIFIYCII